MGSAACADGACRWAILTGLSVGAFGLTKSANPANRVEVEQIGAVIAQIDGALRGLTEAPSFGEATAGRPAKPTSQAIRKSITPKGVRSFIDGKLYQTMKRHLAGHGHTPESYRDAYGLAKDYPMVAPAYAARRSELAKAAGLGSKTRKPATAPKAKG